VDSKQVAHKGKPPPRATTVRFGPTGAGNPSRTAQIQRFEQFLSRLETPAAGANDLLFRGLEWFLGRNSLKPNAGARAFRGQKNQTHNQRIPDAG